MIASCRPNVHLGRSSPVTWVCVCVETQLRSDLDGSLFRKARKKKEAKSKHAVVLDEIVAAPAGR